MSKLFTINSSKSGSAEKKYNDFNPIEFCKTYSTNSPLSGINSKAAVGITSLAEGLTCLVGVISYLIFTDSIVDWSLAPSLVLGAYLSVPLAAYTVKKIKDGNLRLIVGIATLILGIVTLWKILI